MKHIKIAIILAAAGVAGLCAASLPAFAADPAAAPAQTPPASGHDLAGGGHDAPRHHGWRAASRRFRMRRLMNRLGLSDAQRAQVRHLHAQTMVDVWTARADGGLTVDQLHARVRTAFKAQRDGFRGLLTHAQRAQLDQMTGHPESHS